MESSSRPGRVQCTARTAELIAAQDPAVVRLQRRGLISVKGKQGLVETFWVLDLDQAPYDASPPRSPAPRPAPAPPPPRPSAQFRLESAIGWVGPALPVEGGSLAVPAGWPRPSLGLEGDSGGSPAGADGGGSAARGTPWGGPAGEGLAMAKGAERASATAGGARMPPSPASPSLRAGGGWRAPVPERVIMLD